MKEMINELRAINRLLERVRTLAYKGRTPKQMGRMLDDVHYLLNSVIETTAEEPFDRERFIAYLQQIEADFEGLNEIAEGYQEATVHAAMGGKIRVGSSV